MILDGVWRGPWETLPGSRPGVTVVDYSVVKVQSGVDSNWHDTCGDVAKPRPGTGGPERAEKKIFSFILSQAGAESVALL